jgi:hypothetical protein
VSTYHFCYYREQRVYFEVEADSEKEADEAAQECIKGFNLDSPDDQSDDPGGTELREVED